jgi:hypothetical protein
VRPRRLSRNEGQSPIRTGGEVRRHGRRFLTCADLLAVENQGQSSDPARPFDTPARVRACNPRRPDDPNQPPPDGKELPALDQDALIEPLY